MSAEDKIERVLKEIHLLFSNCQAYPGEAEEIIVDKKQVFSLLERLNLAVYEVMDQYEATQQSRDLARRRTEKKGEELITRVSAQAEDVYAASLVYTDDALSRIQTIMAQAMNSSQELMRQMQDQLQQEQSRVKADQLELHEQLQDFKDTNKYLAIIEDCNRQREKETEKTISPEKRIQNEAKHYSKGEKPEIKVNPAYFQRKGLIEDQELEETKSMVIPEIQVNTDSPYFKWKNKTEDTPEVLKDVTDFDQEESLQSGNSGKKERKFPFVKH